MKRHARQMINGSREVDKENMASNPSMIVLLFSTRPSNVRTIGLLGGRPIAYHHISDRASIRRAWPVRLATFSYRDFMFFSRVLSSSNMNGLVSSIPPLVESLCLEVRCKTVSAFISSSQNILGHFSSFVLSCCRSVCDALRSRDLLT